jgi:hypothetical protein
MSSARRRSEVPTRRPSGRISSPLGASRTLDDGSASPSHPLLPSGLETRSRWVAIGECWYRVNPPGRSGLMAKAHPRPTFGAGADRPRHKPPPSQSSWQGSAPPVASLDILALPRCVTCLPNLDAQHVPRTLHVLRTRLPAQIGAGVVSRPCHKQFTGSCD